MPPRLDNPDDLEQRLLRDASNRRRWLFRGKVAFLSGAVLLAVAWELLKIALFIFLGYQLCIWLGWL